MKKLIAALVAIIPLLGLAQSTVPIRADTVKILKEGGNANLVILNGTRDSSGVLSNIGAGKTAFIRTKAITDTSFVVGKDTVRLRTGSGGGVASNLERVEYIVGEVGSPDDGETVFTDAVLVNKTIKSFILEGMEVSFVSRVVGPYITFVSSTGTITLHNATYDDDESVLILYTDGETDISMVTPGDVPDMFAWYDVTDAGARTVSSGEVTALSDKSGNSHTMNQNYNANSYPVYMATGGPNGQPAMHLENNLELLTTSFTAEAQPVTVYLVVRQNSFNTSTQNFVYSLNNSNTFQFQQTVMVAGNSTIMFAGNNFPQNKNGYHSEWVVLRMTYYNDTASIKVNDEPFVRKSFSTGQTGASTMNHIGFGPYYRQSDADVAEMIIYTDEMTRAEDSAIVRYLMTKHGIEQSAYLMLFGDSITWGALASEEDSTGYAALTADSLNFDIVNFGYPGTTVHGGSGGTAGWNLSDIYTRGFTGDLSAGYIVFSFGTNDAGITGEGAPAWKAAYKAIIQDFIDHGADPDKIIILTTPWRPSIETSYLQTCNDNAEEIATELGCNFIDMVAYLFANGAGANLDIDGIHLNDTGHRNQADALIALILTLL